MKNQTWLMMMINIKYKLFRNFFVTILLLTSGNFFAQVNDFQLWSGISIEKEVFNNMSISLEEEVRFVENATYLAKYYTDIGVKYDITRMVNFSVNYRYINEKDYDSPFSSENRFYSDLSFKQSINRLKISFRTRYQFRCISEKEFNMGESAAKYNRNKLSAEYNISNFPISPYISSECFYKIDFSKGSKFDKIRNEIGFEYRLNKYNQIELSYTIQNDLNQANPVNVYFMGIHYGISF
ncbi:MAG: DUF2490 domain-containing protein [Bacteroidales bacterium]|nr:DUF2490 domain-containing protein [Bacteroidales bacterium]